MAREKLARGDARSAEALCREAHTDHGADAELLSLLGRALVEQGRYADAAPFLAQALSLDRKDARAHRDLGESLLHDGRAEVALLMLQRARRLSRDPLPGLDALIERARDATEREGLSVIAAPDDDDGERTQIVRMTDPNLAGRVMTMTALDDPEAEETEVLDAPHPLEASSELGLTDPAAHLLGAATLDDESKENDDETVLYLGPAPGPARERPAPPSRPPPLLSAPLDARARFPVVEAFDDEDDPSQALLADLAAAMPEAHRSSRDRLDLGVDDVLNAVLGGRFLTGEPPAADLHELRPPAAGRRLLHIAAVALAAGALIGLASRLVTSRDGPAGATALSADTRLAFTRFLESTAALDPGGDRALRLQRAYALAAQVADHGGTRADAREALLLLTSLPQEEARSVLGLATLAHLRVAAPHLPEKLAQAIAATPPAPEPLLDALTFHVQTEGTDLPTQVLAHRSLARLALLSGDPLAASRELRLALEHAPEDPATRRELLRLAGSAGALRETRRALETLIRINPNDLEARGDAALWKLCQGGKVTEHEIAALRAAIEVLHDPMTLGRVELLLAVVALQEGDLQGWRRHLSATAADARTGALGQRLRALVAGGVATARPDLACLDLPLGHLLPTPGQAFPFRLESEVLGSLPDTGALPGTVGSFLRSARDAALRLQITAASLSTEGGSSPSEQPSPIAAEGDGPTERLVLAHALLATGDRDAALLMLPREADLPGGESGSAAVAARLLRGLTLHAAGQDDAAAASLGALGRAGYRSLPALKTLGRLQLRRGEAAQALASLERARALSPDALDLAALRVIALHRVGRPDDATLAMSALRGRKRPGTDALLEALPGADANEQATLDLYRAQSEPELDAAEAERLLRRALHTDATLHDAHFHLGRLLARLDRKRAARRSLARYLRAAPEGLYASTARALIETLR